MNLFDEFTERMINKARFGAPLTNKTYRELGCLPIILVGITITLIFVL